MRPSNTATIIRGILIPVSWASTGEITGLAVATFDEREFHVAIGETVAQWRQFLSRAVTVEGFAYEQDGLQWLAIQSLQPID